MIPFDNVPRIIPLEEWTTRYTQTDAARAMGMQCPSVCQRVKKGRTYLLVKGKDWEILGWMTYKDAECSGLRDKPKDKRAGSRLE